EQAPPAVLAPGLVVGREVRDIGEFLAQAQRRVFPVEPDRGLQRTEAARKLEMLILRKLLIGKDQDRVFCEGVLQRQQVGRLDRPRQIDVTDLGGEARRHRRDCNGHEALPERFYDPCPPRSGSGCSSSMVWTAARVAAGSRRCCAIRSWQSATIASASCMSLSRLNLSSW